MLHAGDQHMTGAPRPVTAEGGPVACCRLREVPFQQQQSQWQVDAAVLRLHSRRVTCLEFHPTKDNLVLSGDKKGQVAVWDHEKVTLPCVGCIC